MIDIYELVSPGEKVDIQTVSYDPDNETEIKYYVSNVYDVYDDGTVSVHMPIEKFRMILLQIDREYDLFFYTKKGVYTCRARVTERLREDNVHAAVLQPVTELVKRQRREFFRCDTIIGMNTRKLSEVERDRYMEYKDTGLLGSPEDKSVVVDISGGGMRFISSAIYDEDDLILCRFVLNREDEPKKIDVVTKIISYAPVANNKNNTEYRGSFLYLEDKLQDEIVKYIFEEERKQRRRSK